MQITVPEVCKLARKPAGGRTSISLLGVGGVGSNLVAAVARFPASYQLRIWDHDKIELHNLNRTRIFRVSDVGTWKVHSARSAANQISNTAGGADVVREASALEVRAETAVAQRGALVVDARDTMDPTKLHPDAWIKLAYNGGSEIGFTWRPKIVAERIIDLGGSSNYEVVPSFFVPAAMLSLLALNFARYLNFLEITDLRAGTCTMDLDQVALSVSLAWDPAPEAPGEDAAGDPAPEMMEQAA